MRRAKITITFRFRAVNLSLYAAIGRILVQTARGFDMYILLDYENDMKFCIRGIHKNLIVGLFG